MHRRTFVGGASASLLTGCMEGASTVSRSPSSGGFQEIVEEFVERGKLDISLADVRSARGIETGCCIPWKYEGKAGNGPIGRTVAREFSLAWPEWILHWPEDSIYKSFRGPQLRSDLGFLRSNGKKVRGHTLYWYNTLPDPVRNRALDPSITPGQLGDYIYKTINSRVRRLGDSVSFWVINEAIDFERGHGMRMDPVTSKLGMDTFRIVIAAMKDAAPNKKVEMNDFAIERLGNTNRTNRPAYGFLEELAEHLDKYNLRYDQIGYQCHIDWQNNGKMDFSADRLLQSVRRLNGLGTTFAISEIDVDDRGFRGNPAERQVFVAKQYYDALKRLSSIPRLVEVSTWSAFDSFNWIRTGDKDKGRFANSDVSRTGWFDDNFNRSLNYYAVCKALVG